MQIIKNPNKHRPRRRRNLTAVIALGFLAIIAVGALLLMLPISTVSRTGAPPLTALFTSVSATCVTGLVIVETGTYFSLFGQLVILCLIQIGGLGFMSMAVLLSLVIRRSISPQERMLVAMSYNLSDYGSTTELVLRIVGGTFIIEGAGALILSLRFIPDYGMVRGLYYSVFHSVSAFCNAGFDLLGGGSLTRYAGDPLVCITLMLLIVTGGIGFIVWHDIAGHIRRRRRISVYSRFVLWLTALLVVGGAALVAAFEWNNEATLGSLGTGEKILASFFQSVTWRTAGFNTVDNAALRGATKLTGEIFMFIGGASGSTAGGVKIVTVGVLVWSVICVAVGARDINLFRRRINTDTVLRAVSAVSFQALFVFIATVLVSLTSDAPIIDILYETVSAGGTVGITAGLTQTLSAPALVVLMCMMYLGRVGILTVTYAVTVNLTRKRSELNYPDANMLIG